MLQEIKNLPDYLTRDSSGLANSHFPCPECGRVHSVPIRSMKVGANLLPAVPSVVQATLHTAPKKIGLLYDRAIEDLITSSVIDPLIALRLPIAPIGIGAAGHLLDSEVRLGNSVAASLPEEIDFLIGAGSGVICDLSKWIATHRHIPYMIYATAPSMNAYTSITATMTEDDVKTSRLLDPAEAVWMDIGLQAAAPIDMIHAGLGDLAARSICNADWKLSAFLHGTYFCPVPYLLTAHNEHQYLEACPRIATRELTAIAHLSEAVMLSGLSMTILDGETSPSSGAEHVISHFWDLLTHIRHLPKNFHGTQVGIGTMLMLALYEIMPEVEIGKVAPIRLLRTRPSVEEIERENVRLYGPAAPLFNAVVRKKRIPDDRYPAYIRSIQDRWDELWASVAPYKTCLDSIRSPLKAAGLDLTIMSVHRTRAETVEALTKGPHYRSRYTLLDLASELGLLPDLIDAVLERSGVLG
jgi:glycerol-1-phosphate dehydrogenase [NAD(P)+]